MIHNFKPLQRTNENAKQKRWRGQRHYKKIKELMKALLARECCSIKYTHNETVGKKGKQTAARKLVVRTDKEK